MLLFSLKAVVFCKFCKCNLDEALNLFIIAVCSSISWSGFDQHVQARYVPQADTDIDMQDTRDKWPVTMKVWYNICRQFFVAGWLDI